MQKHGLTTVRVTPAVKQLVREAARRAGTTQAEALRIALAKFLDGMDRDDGPEPPPKPGTLFERLRRVFGPGLVA